jgi:hypothetical protein
MKIAHYLSNFESNESIPRKGVPLKLLENFVLVKLKVYVINWFVLYALLRFQIH